MPKTILITGNPVDGFNYVGPFDDKDAAIAFAEDNIHHEEWWVAELLKPEDLQDGDPRDDAALEWLMEEHQDDAEKLREVIEQIAKITNPNGPDRPSAEWMRHSAHELAVKTLKELLDKRLGGGS